MLLRNKYTVFQLFWRGNGKWGKTNIRVHPGIHPPLWAKRLNHSTFLGAMKLHQNCLPENIREEHLCTSSDFQQLRVASRVVNFLTLLGCISFPKGFREVPRAESQVKAVRNLVATAMTGASRAQEVSSTSLL